MWKIVFCHVLSENGVPPNLNHNFPYWNGHWGVYPMVEKKRWFIDRLVAWQLNGMTQPAWAAQSSKGTASQAFRALLGSLWKGSAWIDRKQWICPFFLGEEGIKGIGCRSDLYHLWRRGLGSVGIGPHAYSQKLRCPLYTRKFDAKPQNGTLQMVQSPSNPMALLTKDLLCRIWHPTAYEWSQSLFPKSKKR